MTLKKENYTLFYLFQCRYSRGVPPFIGGTYIIVLINRLMEWNLDNLKGVELGIACTVDLLWGYPYLVKLFRDGVLCPSVVLSLHKGEIGLCRPGDVPLVCGSIDESLCSSMETEFRGALLAFSLRIFTQNIIADNVAILRGCIDDSSCSSMRTEL